MKKVFGGLVVVLGLAVVSVAAFGGQNILSYVAKAYVGGAATLLNTDPSGKLLVSDGAYASNAVSGVSGTAIVLKAGVGRVVTVNVITANGTPTVYDAGVAGSAVASTKVAVIPATVGTYTIDWPVTNGVAIDPASSVVSVKYN